MDRLKNTVVFAGIILFFTGCVSYTTVELDVLKPAETQIPVEVASVVLVDNAYPFRVTDTTVHEVKLPDSTYVIDSVWVQDFDSLAVQAMGEALEARQFFDSVHVAKKSFNTEEDGKPMRPLRASVVDSLCRHYNAQGVISLSHYDYGTTLEVVEFYDNYMATLDARSSTYWKIFDHVNGELLDVHLQQDTIFWDYVERDISKAVSGVPSLREALKDAAVHAGEKYAGYVAPTWSTEERVLFKQGHPMFARAATLANRGEWEQAARMWYHVYEENDGKVKARAAFNIALSKEVLGEFREAAAWGYRALDEYENLGFLFVSQQEKETAREFYLNLARRIQEKKKLDKQYGVDE
ncbi:MAG: DUF6340 family protein [Bacteroidota bacterium]